MLGCHIFCLGKHVTFLPHFSYCNRFSCPLLERFFGTWFFADGFLFLVNELGFSTKPWNWVMDFDGVGSYMYIVL
jgi:hypothetical protein